MKPFVSVIVPVYNRARLVRDALDSVRRQTYRATELVVVDDGSTDGLEEALADMPDITYARQPRRGSAAARTRGLRLANGDLIASLDSDDIWDPDFLERSVRVLEAENLDLTLANWRLEDSKPSHLDVLATARWRSRYCRRQREEWWLLDPRLLRELVIASCPAPSSALLIRRSAMPAGWNDTVRIADDWYLLAELALARSSRAALTLAPSWTKRLDGTNKFDGRDAVYIWSELFVHDGARLRQDFASFLTPREAIRLDWRARRRRAELHYLRIRERQRARVRGATSS